MIFRGDLLQFTNVDRMVILENKIVFSTSAWFLCVTNMPILALLKHPTTPGKGIPKAWKFEYCEDTRPMDNQPSNVNQWDESDELSELDKWVRFLSQDGPHDELGTNSGGYWLTDSFWDAWKSIMESEGKCMAIISSNILAAPRYMLT